MKGFARDDQLFSLCGLNCGLCPMHLDGYCPGCGGGPGNQSCRIARCSLAHGKIAYCTQCPKFPCAHYEQADEYDSFITHANRRKDLQRALDMGMDAYHAEQRERIALLQHLLSHCNAGRQKTLYCTAANLLDMDSLRAIATSIQGVSEQPVSVLAALATTLFEEAAAKQHISLKLRKKPKS